MEYICIATEPQRQKGIIWCQMKQKPDPDEQAQLNQLSKEELVQLVMEARQKLKRLEEGITQLTVSLNKTTINRFTQKIRKYDFS